MTEISREHESNPVYAAFKEQFDADDNGTHWHTWRDAVAWARQDVSTSEINRLRDENMRLRKTLSWLHRKDAGPTVDGQVEHSVMPLQWTIEFEDERDFCRFASLLIGAPYDDGKGALKRFQDGSLWGERTYGKVTASAA